MTASAIDGSEPGLGNVKRVSTRLRALGREALAVLVWSYALLKLFVFDVDNYTLLTLAPSLVWLLTYKAIVFLAILALIILILGVQRGLLLIAYVTLHPVILLLWRIPYLIFRQRSWTFAIAVLNSLISFFRSLKYNLTTSALYLVSLTTALAAHEVWLLWASSLTLVALCAVMYVRRFISVFKPSVLFDLYRRLFRGLHTYVEQNGRVDQDIRGMAVARLDSSQLTTWRTRLGHSVICNRICVLTAKRLRDYQRSGLSFVSGIVTTLGLSLITILTFATINFALQKIDGRQFILTADPSFFISFYYSFNSFLFNTIPDMVPISYLSQSVVMFERFFALCLVAIFASLLIAVRGQRYAAELDSAISEIESEGRWLETLIRDEYRINSVDEAIAELERVEAGINKILVFLSERFG
jgi:hypothetical protein